MTTKQEYEKALTRVQAIKAEIKAGRWHGDKDDSIKNLLLFIENASKSANNKKAMKQVGQLRHAFDNGEWQGDKDEALMRLIDFSEKMLIEGIKNM